MSLKEKVFQNAEVLPATTESRQHLTCFCVLLRKTLNEQVYIEGLQHAPKDHWRHELIDPAMFIDIEPSPPNLYLTSLREDIDAMHRRAVIGIGSPRPVIAAPNYPIIAAGYQMRNFSEGHMEYGILGDTPAIVKHRPWYRDPIVVRNGKAVTNDLIEAFGMVMSDLHLHAKPVTFPTIKVDNGLRIKMPFTGEDAIRAAYGGKSMLSFALMQYETQKFLAKFEGLVKRFNYPNVGTVGHVDFKRQPYSAANFFRKTSLATAIEQVI